MRPPPPRRRLTRVQRRRRWDFRNEPDISHARRAAQYLLAAPVPATGLHTWAPPGTARALAASGAAPAVATGRMAGRLAAGVKDSTT